MVLADAAKAAMQDRAVLLIPSFAVERAQELVADLVQLMAEGTLPQIPILVDSPLAAKATQVFARHAGDLDGGRALVTGLRSRQVHFTESSEQSKALDHRQGFHIVIAAIGMGAAGRIRAHPGGLMVSPWSGSGANPRRCASAKARVLPRQNHSLVICVDSRCHPAPARLINGNNRGAMQTYAHSDHQ